MNHVDVRCLCTKYQDNIAVADVTLTRRRWPHSLLRRLFRKWSKHPLNAYKICYVIPFSTLKTPNILIGKSWQRCIDRINSCLHFMNGYYHCLIHECFWRPGIVLRNMLTILILYCNCFDIGAMIDRDNLK